jgi:hypothetical protein
VSTTSPSITPRCDRRKHPTETASDKTPAASANSSNFASSRMRSITSSAVKSPVGDQIAQVLEEVECVSVSLGRSASTRAMRALSCSTSARISSRRVVHSPPRQAVRSRGLQARRRATRSGGAALLSCSCVQGCDAQLDRVPYTGSVDPEAEKSPLLCPECGLALGVPHRAATVLGEPGLIRLGLRCPDCWHAWEISVRPEDLPPPPPKIRS